MDESFSRVEVLRFQPHENDSGPRDAVLDSLPGISDHFPLT